MMTDDGMTIRAAVEDDAPTLLRLIHDMAAYEGQADVCVVNEPALRRGLFGTRPYAEAIVAKMGGQTIGFALFFSYFSPYPGVPGMFMELLYVVPEQRGRGHGRALIRQVARIAVERGIGRLEWGVLKENTTAIGFYTRLGATMVDNFMACRLQGDSLLRVAHGSPGWSPGS